MNDEQQPFSVADYGDGPLPNRLTRGTVLGCVGIVGVMMLPLMLFLPLEAWGLPRWANMVIQLLAFCALGGGIWLLARVPPAIRQRSRDPLHPLTARGSLPVLERPATRQNWLGLIIILILLALSATGFALAGFSIGQRNAISLGMAITSMSGFFLTIYGFCIALGRVEPPAFRWVRMPAVRSWLPQGGFVMLSGLVLLGWALLTAAEASLAWGAIGLTLLLIATLLVAPTLQRLPTRGHTAGR